VGVSGCWMTLDEPVVKALGERDKATGTGGEAAHHPVHRVFLLLPALS
jgi:hypothetical protein